MTGLTRAIELILSTVAGVSISQSPNMIISLWGQGVNI